MKGMILAAGVGSRLNPLTQALPKPMAPVANKPVMEYVLEMLLRGGVSDIKVNLHYLPHLIEGHFGNGSRWGAHLSYSLERTLLGTAGAVKRVGRFFDDTFVVAVGDSVWDLDVRKVLEFHRARRAAVTMVVKPMPREDLGRFGVARADENGRITQFQEKPRPEEACSHLASTGFYVLEPSVLSLIPAGEHFDFARDLFPRLLAEKLPFFAFQYDGPWNDIGTFESYFKVHADILHGAYQSLLLPVKATAPGVYQGHHLRIHPEAQIKPPVLIGSYSRIERGAVVGPEAILGEHSVIGEKARVASSVVGARTYVGRYLELEQCLTYGKYLVKLPTAFGLFVEDDTLLADAGRRRPQPRLSRLLDISLGSLGLIGVMPLILGIGLAARMKKRPTLERHWHLAPEHPAAEPHGAPRLRPFQLLTFDTHGRMGRLTERLGITRLPSLYNVVRGDLSLVGTRPLTEEELERVPEEWRHHVFRAPSGFTGLWRLQKDAPLDEQLAVDAYYAASKSFRGDLGILWQLATQRRDEFPHRERG